MNHIDTMKLALNKAFQLGQRYWSWADSEYSSHWKKADAAKAEFDQLVQDTINAALAEQPAQKCSYPYCGCNSKAWCKVERNEALDKKAENARELGLMPFYGGDYEPVCNKDPQGCWNVRCQLGKKCKNTSAQQEPVACECHRCIDEKGLNVNGLPLSMTKMILCPECGNKRCPKASDHRLACTNSNDLGQPGSIYTSPPAEQQEPVAWMTKTGSVWKNKADETDTPLYTSPPAQRTWVGLSDAEIHNMTILMGFNPEWVPEVEMVKSIVRNLEAKLKEKNT